MSSVNLYKTFNYAQPTEYRFSHDSVFLSRYVFEKMRFENLCYTNILDLCSGCGVVGLDFLFHVHKDLLAVPALIDFVELQKDYTPHFEQNTTSINSIFKITAKLNLLNFNYQELKNYDSFRNKYNLILCNPPYFRPSQGRLSNSNFKNRCRFYIDSNLTELISCINYCLSPEGRAYVLIKDLSEHNIDVEYELRAQAELQLSFKKIGKIRSTDLFLFQKA